MLGNKHYVKWSDVVAIIVSQYKRLQVKDRIKSASARINIKKYLPDYDYRKERNGEWLCSIINTLITEEFHVFIKKRSRRMREKLINSKILESKLNLNSLAYSESQVDSQQWIETLDFRYKLQK